MLIDVIAGAPDLLLILAVSVYAACILHLVARDIERARWQREFGGWRTLQQDRIDHVAQYRMVLSLRLFTGTLGRLRFAHDCARGWRLVQRHRIARRRNDRTIW